MLNSDVASVHQDQIYNHPGVAYVRDTTQFLWIDLRFITGIRVVDADEVYAYVQIDALLVPLNGWGAPRRPVGGDRAKTRGVERARPNYLFDNCESIGSPKWGSQLMQRIEALTVRRQIPHVGQRRPIELLPDSEKETVTGWLYSLRDSSCVQGVTIGMCRPFWEVVAAVFPSGVLALSVNAKLNCRFFRNPGDLGKL
jgi:hypothetical protein